MRSTVGGFLQGSASCPRRADGPPADGRSASGHCARDGSPHSLPLVSATSPTGACRRAGGPRRLPPGLAGLVVFLIWIWFTNLALLTGAQFN
ncbi:hypothetical protein ABZ119_30725, partial [Streptomyces sp. NPDC006288]